MKDFSISKKLFVGFGLVLALFMLSVIASLIGLSQVNGQVTRYAKETVPNEESIRVIQVKMEGIARFMLEANLGENMDYIKGSLDEAQASSTIVAEEIEALKSNQDRKDLEQDIANLEEIIAKCKTIRAQIGEKLLTGNEADKVKSMRLYWDEYKPSIDSANELIVVMADKLTADAVDQRAEATRVVMIAWIVLIVLAVVSMISAVRVAIVIRTSILSPITEIVAAYEDVAKGSLKTNIEYDGKDEMGKMAVLISDSLEKQRILIEDLVENLVKLAEGDLRIQMAADYPGDYRIIKTSMEETAASLNETLSMINITADHVSSGADSVSGGAQALAAGSTEQASEIEELNTSSIEVAKWAEENVEQVKVTNEHLQKTANKVDEGNRYMDKLTEAMSDISSASSQIVGITKVIGDIATQTNLLSLNAAIEAARAGDAGKGFAVVADEVRDLAAKSAEAAQQTIELIQNSVNSVAAGTQITEQTAKILKEVEGDTQEVVAAVSKIQKISEEQRVALEQIREGLHEVSAVIQTNAATSEENSAVSEELSAQASILNEVAGKFKLCL